MSRPKTLFALLLLALWVPATAHCALEAAGWLGEAEGCCAEKKIDCGDDSCREIEGGVIKPANPSIQVSAPLLGPSRRGRGLGLGVHCDFRESPNPKTRPL